MPSLAQLSGRQREILDLANDRGFVSVEDLASTFSVTTQTVRRDLNELCDIGFLKRFHGGAGLPTSAENISYDNRTKMALTTNVASQVRSLRIFPMALLYLLTWAQPLKKSLKC